MLLLGLPGVEMLFYVVVVVLSGGQFAVWRETGFLYVARSDLCWFGSVSACCNDSDSEDFIYLMIREDVSASASVSLSLSVALSPAAQRLHDAPCVKARSDLLFPSTTERKVPPTFTKRPSESVVESVGRTVRMEGRVSGSLPLSVSWFRDDSEIFASDKYELSFHSNVATLSLRDCSLADSSTYTCVASNEAGKASCRVSVHISGTSLWYSLTTCQHQGSAVLMIL